MDAVESTKKWKRTPTPKKDRIPGAYRSYQLFGDEVLEKSDRDFPGLKDSFPVEVRSDPTPESVTGHLVRELSSRYEGVLARLREARAANEQLAINWDEIYGLHPGTYDSYQKIRHKLPFHNKIVGHARELDLTCGDAYD